MGTQLGKSTEAYVGFREKDQRPEVVVMGVRSCPVMDGRRGQIESWPSDQS
jgi:hypothetical protein